MRPLVLWFSEDIRESRRERRRAERKQCRSRRVRDLLEIKMRRNFTTYLMNEARRKFYSDFIAENNSNQRNLFSATKRLLNQGHEVPFPPTSDKLVLANEMGSFFVEKIDAIHVKLDRLADCLHDSHFDYVETLPTRTLDSFISLTESAVSKLIGCSLSQGKNAYNIGTRSFSAAAPKLWNGLPVELRQATSLNGFKSRLKTYLFKKYFYSL